MSESEIAASHKDPSNGPGFTRLDKLRLGGKATRVLLKTIVPHPSFMFGTLGEMFGYIREEDMQKKEAMMERTGDRVFIDMANYILKQEMGNETHRLYIADHLAGLRYEYGLPPDMPIQELRKAI